MTTMNSWCKSAAWSVFKHSMMEKGDVAELCLHTAKNMHSSGFFCLRDSMKSFDILSAEFEGVPDGVRAVSYLQDEPNKPDSWLWVRNIARRELPDVPCSEAIYLRNIAHALDEECDIPIPRIDIFNEEPCLHRLW